jgi:hypothetical protein
MPEASLPALSSIPDYKPTNLMRRTPFYAAALAITAIIGMTGSATFFGFTALLHRHDIFMMRTLAFLALLAGFTLI